MWWNYEHLHRLRLCTCFGHEIYSDSINNADSATIFVHRNVTILYSPCHVSFSWLPDNCLGEQEKKPGCPTKTILMRAERQSDRRGMRYSNQSPSRAPRAACVSTWLGERHAEPNKQKYLVFSLTRAAKLPGFFY